MGVKRSLGRGFGEGPRPVVTLGDKGQSGVEITGKKEGVEEQKGREGGANYLSCKNRTEVHCKVSMGGPRLRHYQRW